MDFEVKKAQNCFADAENYEYRIAMNGAELLALLSAGPPQGLGAEARINSTLRRPTFYAELADGERIKGLMDRSVIKVGYVPARAQEQKSRFESWLEAL